MSGMKQIVGESDVSHNHTTRDLKQVFGQCPKCDIRLYRTLGAEVERLTAEHDERERAVDNLTSKLYAAEAREAALRTITGEMRAAGWMQADSLDEWDRRAGEVT